MIFGNERAAVTKSWVEKAEFCYRHRSRQALWRCHKEGLATDESDGRLDAAFWNDMHQAPYRGIGTVKLARGAVRH